MLLIAVPSVSAGRSISSHCNVVARALARAADCAKIQFRAVALMRCCVWQAMFGLPAHIWWIVDALVHVHAKLWEMQNYIPIEVDHLAI